MTERAVRPTYSARQRSLTATESSVGTESGDDVDWDTSPNGSYPAPGDQWKQPVRVATTANVTISTALNAGDTIDGVTLAAGDRVLVKDQSTGSQNGIYIAGTTPERATDMDDDDEVLGAVVYVIAGTANGGKVFKNTNTSAPTIGSTSLTFAEFTATTSYGTPANTYGTPAAGAASTAIRTDATLPGPNIVVLSLTNKSGGAIAAGDVVVVDTANDGAFTTTTTGRAEVSVGIAQESIANNATGKVLVSGYAALVNVPSSVTRGHYVETHTVAKQATGNSTRRSGSFGQFLTGGTTPTAWLWGQTDQTASGGGSLTVEEVDGSPTDSAVTKIVFPNGTLGIASHVATYTPAASGGLTNDDKGALQLQLARPSEVNTEDDQFDAGTLAAKWLAYTGLDGVFDLTAMPGWAKCTTTGAKLQAVPAGDWIAEAEIIHETYQAAAYTADGIIFTTGTTWTTSTAYVAAFGYENNLGNTRVVMDKFINGAYSSSPVSIATNNSPGTRMHRWIRVVKSGTNYYLETSDNGRTWGRASGVGTQSGVTHFGFKLTAGAYIGHFVWYTSAPTFPTVS